MRHDNPGDHQHARDQQQQVEVVRRTSRVRSRAWKFMGSLPRQRAGPAARGETNATDYDGPYAAFFCSICLLSFDGVLPAIWIRRGFIASGISRTSSTFSSPFSKLAPFTCM